ncbi:MAG: hypothetical protein PHP98_06165 [Kiritimatiellae bacterium]|nr:hypothetical protein [Kiritimatiellia bacterium]
MIKTFYGQPNAPFRPPTGGRPGHVIAACGGQATIEYAVTAGVLMAVAIIMGIFLTTFGEYGERLLAIIASDYP